jgi:hypothetical protein
MGDIVRIIANRFIINDVQILENRYTLSTFLLFRFLEDNKMA